MADPNNEKDNAVTDEHTDTPEGRDIDLYSGGLVICENGSVLKADTEECPYCGSTNFRPFVLRYPG